MGDNLLCELSRVIEDSAGALEVLPEGNGANSIGTTIEREEGSVTLVFSLLTLITFAEREVTKLGLLCATLWKDVEGRGEGRMATLGLRFGAVGGILVIGLGC